MKDIYQRLCKIYMYCYLFAGLNLQDSASLVMREFAFFHDISFWVVIPVGVFVALLLGVLSQRELVNRTYLEGKSLEIV